MLESKKFEFNLGEGKTIEVTLRVSSVEEQDVEKLSIPELEEYIEQLQEKLDDLEGEEPDDDDSEEYEEWEEECDLLQDMIDDAQNRLDELQG